MGWMKTVNPGDCETGKVNYSAFASDLEAFIGGSERKVRCPVCCKKLNKNTLFQNAKAVGDEPVALFEPECPSCHVELTIFND